MQDAKVTKKVSSRRKTTRVSPYLRKAITSVVNLNARSELKAFDSYDQVAGSDIGSLTDLSVITVGTGYSNRIGDYVMPAVMELHLHSLYATSDVYNVCRYVLFRWHMDNAAEAPATTDILMNSMGTTIAPLNHYVFSGRDKFTVLLDVTHDVNTYNPVTQTFHKIPMRKPIEYTAGTNTGTDHLYLLRISDVAYNEWRW